METIGMVLVPFLAVIVFVRSKSHFSLFKWVNTRLRFEPHYPPTKGRGSLSWLALPVSTLVLVGYGIRLVAWLQAHLLLVALTIGVGALVIVIWRKRIWIVEEAAKWAMVPDRPHLQKAREAWQNSMLP